MKHEALGRFPFQRIHALLVIRRAQRRRHQSLGLTAREQGRPVRARQQRHLGGDRADLVEPGARPAGAVLQNFLAEDLLHHVLIDLTGLWPGAPPPPQGSN